MPDSTANIEQQPEQQPEQPKGLFSHTYLGKLAIERKSHPYLEAYLCISTHPFSALREKQEQFLHPDELAYADTLAFERRQKSFLLGRYCAKQALSPYLREPDMRSISVCHGVFEQPIVRYPACRNAQVSISHTDEWGGAIAFPEEHPMAIDMEKINPDRKEAIQTHCTAEESRLIKSVPGSDILQLTLLWTVKEALSKVLKCGFMSPFTIFEVQRVEPAADCFIWTFKNFAQYKAVSCIIEGTATLEETAPRERTACSIVTPKRTEVLLDVKGIERGIHCTARCTNPRCTNPC